MILGLGELIQPEYQDPETKLSSLWLFRDQIFVVRKAEHVKLVFQQEYDRKDMGFQRVHMDRFLGKNNVTMLQVRKSRDTLVADSQSLPQLSHQSTPYVTIF